MRDRTTVPRCIVCALEPGSKKRETGRRCGACHQPVVALSHDNDHDTTDSKNKGARTATMMIMILHPSGNSVAASHVMQNSQKNHSLLGHLPFPCLLLVPLRRTTTSKQQGHLLPVVTSSGGGSSDTTRTSPSLLHSHSKQQSHGDRRRDSTGSSFQLHKPPKPRRTHHPHTPLPDEIR